MAAQPPLIPYLRNVKRWCWIGIFGGGVLFIGLVAVLDALAPPDTPANHLVNWKNGWVFLLPAAMAIYGLYVSVRYWCCPQCGQGLPTRSPVPDRCRGCGTPLRA